MEIGTEYEVVEEISLSPSETALIIVDMQNDFVKTGGKLRVPDAEKTIEPIQNLLKRAREKDVPVFYTQDWHRRDDPEFKIWGEHALADSWGAEMVEELKPEPQDIVIRKTRYDGFYGTPLDEYLRLLRIEYLLITGTVSNICVLHTAGSAALRFYGVIVPIDCVSALNPFDLHLSMRQIYFLYRGTIVERALNILFEEE